MGDDGELPERIRPQQLLDYIMAADESHFEQTDTAVIVVYCSSTGFHQYTCLIPHMSHIFYSRGSLSVAKG